MKTVVSGLVFFCVTAVFALLAGFGSGLTPMLASVSLAIGALGGAAAWNAIQDLPRTDPVRGWAAWSVITVFTLFALRSFCWLIFVKDGELAFLSPNNLGDLSLHLTFIRYLAQGAPLWPDNPIYAAAPLHYPFGVDLFNSVLTLAGVDLFGGLIWVGLLASLATGVALWRWGGAFAMAGFLFNGGIAGFALFATGKCANYQAEVDWKSIPLALFVTQRGLLYAIPAGLSLLWSWRSRFLRGEPGLPLWIELLLYATLPLFHLHTFLFLSFLLGCWWLVPMRNGHACPRRIVFQLGLLAFLPATALMWLLTGGFHSGSSIHLNAGWMEKSWIQNFGVLPIIIAALLCWLWLHRKRPETLEHTAAVIPSLLLFTITCFVIFAPWEWDNTKMMLWCYLAVLPALWAMLRETAPAMRLLACIALFFSGAVSLLGGLDATHVGYRLANRAELDRLTIPLQRIPITATFACLPTYNHPLLLLGRKVIAGYDGHLSSHGIDYTARFADLERLLRGEPGWQIRARELGVDYLFWGDREQEKYGGPTPWKETAPLVAQGPWGTIYDLRGETK
ncbi:MAG: hypothetical protein NTZ46_08355 [Verrucomicrobia bacterium]|nr:hypothetical protein [Verrucomicrobiota bacterium]